MGPRSRTKIGDLAVALGRKGVRESGAEDFLDSLCDEVDAAAERLHPRLRLIPKVVDDVDAAVAPLLRKRAARGSAAAGRVAPTPVSPAPEEADVSGTLPEASGTLPEVAEEPQLIELSTCTFLHPDHEVTSRGQTFEVAGVVVSVWSRLVTRLG